MSANLTQVKIKNYRPDIDGLRALAVISVLVFHAFPEWLPGGFAGVDVFFVISGFLITGIIWRENILGKFSFLNFYARRVRRIFPALILVLLTCAVAGWYLLFDDEYKQLGDHSMRAGLFLSNFVLWRESGYFDAKAELKPLLHLWSLAIEEQFYIVWPAVIWYVIRKCRHPLYLLMAILFLSFLWNVYQSEQNPVHDFYSPLTRFWELMAGAVLAIALASYGDHISADRKRVFGMIGIVILLYSMIWAGTAKVYPGIWATWPVLGAVFFIASEGQSPWLQRIMTAAATLWVGEISYALYLWHWPVLSFARIVEGQTPPVYLRLAALLLSFVFAALTSRFVEKNFRYGSIQNKKIALLLFLMAVIFVGGFAIKQHKGFSQRNLMRDEYVVHLGNTGHDQFLNMLSQKFQVQKADFEFKNHNIDRDMLKCLKSDSSKPSDIILLGDSHAEHLLPGLAEVWPTKNFTFCGFGGLPLWGNPIFPLVLEELKSSHNAPVVLLTAQWHSRLKEISDPIDELEKTLKILQMPGVRFFLIDDIYQFDFDPQRCKYARPLSGRSNCEASRSLAERQFEKYMPVLNAVQKRIANSQVLSIRYAFCSEQNCSMLVDDFLGYRDSHHLNDIGSRYVAGLLMRQIKNLN